MIETLTSLAGRIDPPAGQRWHDVAKESDIYKGLTGYAPTDTGICVNERNALTYMPVLACTRVISETWASLPLKIFRDSEDGPEVAKDHYLYPILHDEPNPEMSSFNFWEAMGVSLCLYNHAYAEIEWNRAGRVRALWPLLPDRVDMRRIGKRLVYDYRADDGLITFDAENVLHIPGCLNLTGLAAESLIKWAREAIGLGLAPQKYAANFYKNNARPGMYLTTSQVLTGQVREQMRAEWNNVHSGINGAGKTGVLEGGMEIKVPSVNQKDAEFSITRDQQLLEVCRIYRVPPHMIADLSRATFSNIEHQDIGFGKHTMTPYAKRAEQSINRKLIGIGSGYYSEFLMDGLMRGDLLSRTQAQAQAVQNALLTPNEGRAMENRRKIVGGHKLYIQGATVPLEDAGRPQDGGNSEAN